MQFFINNDPKDDSTIISTKLSNEDMMTYLLDPHHGAMIEKMFIKVVEGLAEKFMEEKGKEILELIPIEDVVKAVADKTINEISSRIFSAIQNQSQSEIHYSGPADINVEDILGGS